MSAPTPAADRIPLLQKIMVGAGVNTDSFATSLMKNVLWMPFFNIGMGMSPAILSMILVIFQIWNAFMDPIMGNISDNARTRWGRRRPYMVVGAVLIACIYPFIWRAPFAWGETGAVFYLIGIGLLFYTSFSVWAMPYYALQIELTPNYDERTRLSAWITFFGKISSLGSSWILALLTCGWFLSPLTGKPDLVIGLKTCSWGIAVLILIFGLLPAIFVKERYYKVEAKQRTREPLLRSLRESAKCKPLWNLIGISFFAVVGTSALGSLGQYLNFYYVFDGDIGAAAIVSGWKGTATVVFGIASIPLWTWLSERYDKRAIVFAMLTLTMLGHLMNYFCMRPDMPYLQLIPGVFESCALGAVWMFIPSMKADIADYDEVDTHHRREGALNAFFSWFIKASFTCSIGLSGIMLEISGFTSKVAHQTPEVLHRMMMFYLFVPTAIWIIALFFVYRYPLSRGRMAEIRTLLEARRGKI
ncbi:MAG: MFS transporter [Rariglobus sp.]|nr:MFS transporter [Rariglobus sp.]